MKVVHLISVLMIVAGANAIRLKRQNSVTMAATAYPTIPPLINLLTSNLFQRGNISGESAIYQFLSNLSSMVYPAIANATFNTFKSLNPILAGISSNIYFGLCAPPTPQSTKNPSTNPPTNVTTPSINPISILPLLGSLFNRPNATLCNPSPTMGPTMGPSPGNASGLASILPLLGSIFNRPNATFSNPSPTMGPISSPGNASGLASLLPLLVVPIITALSGSNSSSPTSSPGVINPLASILGPLLGANSSNISSLSGGNSTGTPPSQDPYAFLNNVFDPVSGYNGTFNLSKPAFSQLLANIGQTIQNLQAALSKLGLSPLQFVQNFPGRFAILQTYLSSIFSQAANSTAAPSTTNSGNTFINQLLTFLGNLLRG